MPSEGARAGYLTCRRTDAQHKSISTKYQPKASVPGRESAGHESLATTAGEVAEDQGLHLILEPASLSQSHAGSVECLGGLQVNVKQLPGDLGQSEVLFDEENGLMIQSLDVGGVEAPAFVDSAIASWEGQRCRSAVGRVELTRQAPRSLPLSQPIGLLLGEKV